MGYIEFRIFWSISNNSKERCTCLTNILERIFHIVCLYDNCYSCLNMERYKYANSYYSFTYACSRVFLKFDIKLIIWRQKNNTYISSIFKLTSNLMHEIRYYKNCIVVDEYSCICWNTQFKVVFLSRPYYNIL